MKLRDQSPASLRIVSAVAASAGKQDSIATSEGGISTGVPNLIVVVKNVMLLCQLCPIAAWIVVSGMMTGGPVSEGAIVERVTNRPDYRRRRSHR